MMLVLLEALSQLHGYSLSSNPPQRNHDFGCGIPFGVTGNDYVIEGLRFEEHMCTYIYIYMHFFLIYIYIYIGFRVSKNSGTLLNPKSNCHLSNEPRLPYVEMTRELLKAFPHEGGLGFRV